MEKLERLRKLKEDIEKIESSFDYDEYYTSLLNTCIDYQNETQDWDYEFIFNDVIDYEIAEERATYELEAGGLIRLYYFLGDANLNNSIFMLDGYGNLKDISKLDLDYIKEQILEITNQKIEDEEKEQEENIEPGFYETDGDGLIYKSKKATYHLLEGKCSNGLTSDIVFIMREMEDDGKLDFVNYCYGAFKERDGIKEYIEEYERRMF